MARIRKILVPIDFSEPSRKALPHTRELANRFDSEIVILHVRTPYADDPNRPELRFLDEGKYQAWTEEQVDRLSKEIEEHHRVSTRIIRDISPASGILEYL
ncbi:MAG TPA: universal stress protein, partial [Acidobacteriota bacterium]|nr:universal stress protein [Acidobacteriota bacterium]